jgi:ATPase subunit of ABC transporter with duplicated ATPase domains
VIVTLAGIYAEQLNINYNAFFAANLGKFTYGKRSIMNAYLKYLSQQGGEVICKEALEVLEVYFNQSSDADKANTILNFLNQWKRKSKLEGFFEGEGFKAFYAKMEAATKI